MDTTSYPFFFVTGLALAGGLHVWRKAAQRWNAWFPVLRKTLEWGLFAFMGLVALYSLYAVAAGPLPALHTVTVFLLGLAAPELFVRFRASRESVKEETQRGSQLASPKDVAKRVKASKQKTFLDFGGVPIPEAAEPYHFLVAGSTGTGKSVLIKRLLQMIRERGDTAIVVDSGGDFLDKHFVEGRDFVFNPYDERCVGWSPTLEMQGAWDAQALARSIIPDGIGESKEWNSYAQTFVGSVLRKLWEANKLSLADFLYYVQVASVKELKELLSGTPAASQLSSEKTFGSIRTIATNYLASYDYLPTDQTPFSLTEMVNAEHSGVLFITYAENQLDSVRNMIATMLDVASRAILSLQPNPNRRIWLIIDEFASIGRVQSIEAMATKARKAGGCLVLGIQSISQLQDRYGDKGAQTILSCLSSWVVLRSADADTAEYMSRHIGDAEVARTHIGQSSGDSGDSSNVSEQRVTKRVVLASQIQQLENLHGYLKLAGGYPVCDLKLSFPAQSATAAGSFIARDFRARPLMLLAPSAVAAAPASEQTSSAQTPPAPASAQAPQVTPAASSSSAAPQPKTAARVGVTVSDDAFRRFQQRQAAASKNLLVELSRGVPTLDQRLKAARVEEEGIAIARNRPQREAQGAGHRKAEVAVALQPPSVKVLEAMEQHQNTSRAKYRQSQGGQPLRTAAQATTSIAEDTSERQATPVASTDSKAKPLATQTPVRTTPGAQDSAKPSRRRGRGGRGGQGRADLEGLLR